MKEVNDQYSQIRSFRYSWHVCKLDVTFVYVFCLPFPVDENALWYKDPRTLKHLQNNLAVTSLLYNACSFVCYINVDMSRQSDSAYLNIPCRWIITHTIESIKCSYVWYVQCMTCATNVFSKLLFYCMV